MAGNYLNAGTVRLVLGGLIDTQIERERRGERSASCSSPSFRGSRGSGCRCDVSYRGFRCDTPGLSLDCWPKLTYDLKYGESVQEGDLQPAVLVPAGDGLGERQTEDGLRAVPGHRRRHRGAAGRPRGRDGARTDPAP